MENGEMFLADTHIHLSHWSFENTFSCIKYGTDGFVVEKECSRESLIHEMRERDIVFCVEPAIELESNARVLALAEKYPGFVYPAVGIHPTRTRKYSVVDENGKRVDKLLPWKARAQVKKYAENDRVVAIGETGLDYHLPRREQHRLRQILWFVWQLALARKKKLPVILHIRQADQQALRILRFFKRSLHGGVCHCFNGTAEAARQYVSLGLKLGIGASLLRDVPDNPLDRVIRETDIEDLLLETDGPYVKPPCPGISSKQRNKARNTSLILPAVVGRIAELKGLTEAEVRQITTYNARKLFRIS